MRHNCSNSTKTPEHLRFLRYVFRVLRMLYITLISKKSSNQC